MIPNIETGTSFRGAQLYYLHDKREAGELLRLSDERVAWTETRNTAQDRADDAFAEMIATARDQNYLKMQNGMRLSGRSCEQPVMTISLSWHPSEKPSKEQMIAAADSYLKHMGWDEHQAVYAAHNDTAHSHLHIVLNRIHPETGKVLDDAFSKNRSQEWARDYERDHGRAWCQERIGKDYGRGAGQEPRSLPHDFAIDARETQRRYLELEEAARTLDQHEKEKLAKHHQDQREAFFETRHQQFRQAREAAYQEVREEYKERWVEHFRHAEQACDRTSRDAAALALQVLEFARQGDFAAAWEALRERDGVKRSAERSISDERRDLRAAQRTQTRERQEEVCAELYEERAQAFIRIKQRQKEERAELKELQFSRTQGEPYDKDRLIELVTESVADRLADPPRATGDSPVQQSLDDAQRPVCEAEFLADAVTETARLPSEVLEQRIDERAGSGRATSDPVADAGMIVAGGIGKVAEVLADALANLISPPSPKEQAMDRALDQARDRAEAERQPLREEADKQIRMILHENQRTAIDIFESFFNEHAERLRREEEHRLRERTGLERER